MTTEELNRRCRFFAKFNLPYSDTVWRLLAEAFDHGYESHKKGEQHRNPYQAVLCRGEGPGLPHAPGAPTQTETTAAESTDAR